MASKRARVTTPVNQLSQDDLFRMAGIHVTPVHRDGKTYVRAHPDSANSGVVVDPGELEELIRDWWRLRVKLRRRHNASEGK